MLKKKTMLHWNICESPYINYACTKLIYAVIWEKKNYIFVYLCGCISDSYQLIWPLGITWERPRWIVTVMPDVNTSLENPYMFKVFWWIHFPRFNQHTIPNMCVLSSTGPLPRALVAISIVNSSNTGEKRKGWSQFINQIWWQIAPLWKKENLMKNSAVCDWVERAVDVEMFLYLQM